MHDRLQATIEQAVLVEQLGFQGFYVTEHHLSSYGLVANPAIMLAMIAARTRVLKLGPAIANLHVRTPLSVAEDYALLDQLSSGRVMLGIGPGFLPEEMDRYKVDARTRTDVFWQRARQTRELLANKPVVEDDTHLALKGAELGLPTERLVGPRISVATFNAESAFRAGAEGFGLMLMPHACCRDWAELEHMVQAFTEGFKQRLQERDSALTYDVRPSIALFMPIHLGSSEDAAEQAFDLHMATRNYPLLRTLSELAGLDFAITANTASPVELLARLANLGVSEFVGLHAFGGLDKLACAESLQVFAEDILPRYHRLTRPVESTLQHLR